jgi:hypothetical protein
MGFFVFCDANVGMGHDYTIEQLPGIIILEKNLATHYRANMNFNMNILLPS